MGEDKSTFIECVCGDPGHLLRMDLYVDEYPYEPEILVSFQLNHNQPWYRRVVIGLRFIFGMPSWTNWGNTILSKETVDQMSKLLTAWQLVHKLREKRRESERTKQPT